MTSETSGAHLEEEPQSERGPMGSRDEGSDDPAGGPVDRPTGTSEADTDTSVQPQEPESGAPNLQTGDGG